MNVKTDDNLFMMKNSLHIVNWWSIDLFRNFFNLILLDNVNFFIEFDFNEDLFQNIFAIS